MEFPSQAKTVIIATKGLPYTGKENISCDISAWATSPVFSLDEILEEMYEKGGYNATRRPSTEEDEHLQRLAFSMLCRVAGIQLWLPRTNFKCVVVESPLSFTFQLDQLIELSTKYEPKNPHKLVILEFRMRHKYFWKILTDVKIGRSDRNKKWFLPGSWNEVEKAICDYDAKAWDEHYHLMCSNHPHLKRLVLDPYLDLRRNEFESKDKVSLFAKAIEYVLTDEGTPAVIEYHKWRRKLVEGLLDARSSTISIKLCSNGAGDCIFKHKKHVVGAAKCSVCEQRVAGEAYTCISCGLALHNSCAEFRPVDLYIDTHSAERTFDGSSEEEKTKRQACKSCKDLGKSGFSYECGRCIFETHLKCRLVPTVVYNPRLHPHSLSIHFFPVKADSQQVPYAWELCSLMGAQCCYYCVVCNSSYHLRCVHSPVQVEHEHGRHHHPMMLVIPPDNDKDDYLDPDDFWCDVCYNDIDEHAGFYSCQECPDYVAHIYCVSHQWA